jgi:hypothetical protein
MSNEEEVVQDVLDEFSVQCQHIGGNTCFVPTEAVRRFVDVCHHNGMILAHGDVHVPKDGHSPVLSMVSNEVFAALSSMAGRANLSVSDLASACISSVLTNGDVVAKIASAVSNRDPMDSVPAPGETHNDLPPPGSTYTPATESNIPPDPWAFKMDYGEPTEKSEEFEYEPRPPKPLPVESIPGLSPSLLLGAQGTPTGRATDEFNSDILPRLRGLVDTLHSKKSSDLSISLGFNEIDQVDLDIRYPEQGFAIHEVYHGDFDKAILSAADRIEKWGSVAFSPKLEEGEAVSAKVAIEIIKFDATKGKYQAKVGDTVIWIDPEVVDAA